MKHKQILVMPDTQNEWGKTVRHWYYAGCVARDWGCTLTVHMGDVNDHLATSSFDKDKPGHLVGRSIKKDYEIEYKAKEEWDRGLKGWSTRTVMLEGNHDVRPRLFAERNPAVADLVYQYESARRDLWDVIVPYQEPICLSGIWYSHMFVRTTTGKVSARSVRSGASSAKAQLQSNLASCTAGHIPGFDYAEFPTQEGLKQSMIVGSYYPHHQAYSGPQGNLHWNGLVIKTMTGKGQYDFQRLSLKQLKRMYD